MLTIERFYGRASDIAQSVTASQDGDEYCLAFIPPDDDGDSVFTTVVVRGEADFRQLLAEIAAAGASILGDRPE